jgi:hypothetical protein
LVGLLDKNLADQPPSDIAVAVLFVSLLAYENKRSKLASSLGSDKASLQHFSNTHRNAHQPSHPPSAAAATAAGVHRRQQELLVVDAVPPPRFRFRRERQP